VKAIAACDEVAKDLRRFATVVKSYLRGCGIEVVNRNILSFKENLALGCEPRRYEVLHDLLLRIDRDTAPRQGFEIYAMPLFPEANFHTIMDQAFPLHSLA
jgi:hypothetical protein